MKIKMVFLGKTRNPHFRALIEDYRKRLAHFTSVELIEWKTTDGGAWTIDEVRGKQKSTPVVLLDAAGQAQTSKEFAQWVNQQVHGGRQLVIFLLGGAEGFAEETKKKSTMLLSLSKMTMPHELARVVLLEQLYRAFAYLREHPYPK